MGGCKGTTIQRARRPVSSAEAFCLLGSNPPSFRWNTGESTAFSYCILSFVKLTLNTGKEWRLCLPALRCCVPHD